MTRDKNTEEALCDSDENIQKALSFELMTSTFNLVEDDLVYKTTAKSKKRKDSCHYSRLYTTLPSK
jgi:hypothetical protein